MQQSAGASSRSALNPGNKTLKKLARENKKTWWFTFEEICNELGVLAAVELLVR